MKHPAKKIDLSIIIPAYREERRIGKSLDELATFIKNDTYFKDKELEIIVVSADSGDRTHEIATEKGKQFPNFTLITPGPRVGKGRDVKEGMLNAKGSTILFMDADLSTPLHHIKEFHLLCTQGADIVIATRGARRQGNSILRVCISTAGNILYRLAGGVWLEDSQCGFKMFSAEAAQTCFRKLKIMGWGFDMEILTAAKANRLQIKDVRVDDWKPMPYGTFEDSIITNSFHALSDLLRIFSRRLTGYYKYSDKKM
jgi:dolichyl-phosphate beta-glucosyltransferase